MNQIEQRKETIWPKIKIILNKYLPLEIAIPTFILTVLGNFFCILITQKAFWHTLQQNILWFFVILLILFLISLLFKRFRKYSAWKQIFRDRSYYISICIILIGSISIFGFKDTIQSFFSPKDKLVVLLTHFEEITGQEKEFENSLIKCLKRELGRYREAITVIDSVYPAIKNCDSLEAKELGRSIKGVHLVIYGMIWMTKKEAKIEPHIAICKPLGKARLEPLQPEVATNIAIADIEDISFAERKVTEIADIVLFILGLAKYELNKYQEAIKVFESIQNKNAEIFFYIGNSYAFLLKPDFSKAANAYQMAIQRDSNFSQVYANWGGVLVTSGWYEEAIEKCKKAIRLNPKHYKAYSNWGVALGNLGRYEEAIEKFKEAVRLDPNYADAYSNWGVALGNLGRYEEAIEKFKEAVRLNPDDAYVYYNWGVALGKLARYEEAIEKYKEAIRLKPNHAEAYCNWGVTLGNLGRYEEAIEKYKKAVRINPDDADTYSSWGVALMNLGRNQEAIEKYKKAVRLNPNYAEAYYNWGVALINLGRYEEAIGKYKEAVRLNPDDAEAYSNWGVALMILGRKEEAKEKFLRAKELFKRQGKDEDVKKIEELLEKLEGE